MCFENIWSLFSSSRSSPLVPSPLRVVPRQPGPPDAHADGAAVRWWPRRGAGVVDSCRPSRSSISLFSLVVSFMELGFMLSFLLLRLAWLLPSSSYGMVSPSSGEDPWWMTQVEGRSKSSCLNKLDEACYSADLVSSQFFLCWLGAREEDRELLVSAAVAAWWGELRQGYSSCPESCEIGRAHV